MEITKPSLARSTNHCLSWFAILFGAQMIGLCRTGRRQPFHSAHMRPHGPRPVSLTLPIRSEGCRRLRTRLPQRVFQRECLDLHAGIEDTSRGQVRRRVSAFVDQNKSSATSA
jgi:hypothetical protein